MKGYGTYFAHKYSSVIKSVINWMNICKKNTCHKADF